MDRSKSTRVLALVLCLVMIIGILPVVSFAADGFSLTIASTKTSALAPGVQEQEIVAYDANGDRIVYYTISADVATNPDVQVKANYHDNDNTGNWGKATVVEQANAAAEKRGYNVVASTNASYYNVSTGQPSGGFVMEGVNINGNGAGNSYPFFAILKDGTAMIGQKGTFSQYADRIQEAVGGWTMLVWDGKIVAANSAKYPRSTVGVKANGDVVLMVADGNQSPYSIGLTLKEQAEIMVQMGCVAAVELDGGGSATYAAKLEGTDEVVVRNSCCDGTVRSVSNTLMVISTAVADGTFDHANLATDYVFYAPYSKVEIDATGADKSGYPAEIPAGAVWSLSDDSFGTIADGVFTSSGKLGKVTAFMTVDGKTVGSIDINLVHPTEIAFGAEEKTMPYGKPSDFTITALYNGADMYAGAEAYTFACTAGSMNGFVYTAPAEGAGETATVTAAYKYAELASDTITVKFGKGSDILFNFEDGIDGWGTYFDLKDAAASGEYTGGFSVNHQAEGATTGNLIEYGMHENVFLATKENGGKVYSGEQALGYTMDYRYSVYHGNWLYAYLYFWGDPVTLLDTDNGVAGTRLGMWMYIPEEAVGSCARFCYTTKKADGTLSYGYQYLTYMYVEKGFSKLTSEQIPEAGWAYVYVDLNTLSDSYVSTMYYKDDSGKVIGTANSNYAPGFIQFIKSSSAVGAEKVTFYIDDITLDYSDAVDDRDMPIISDPQVLDGADSKPINGGTISFNEINVVANAVEDTTHGTNYTGLNESTAQVYVDGREVPTAFSAGKISASGIKLADGIHDITFEIADKQGNYTRLTRQINVQAGTDYPSLTLTGKAPAVNKDGNIYTGGQFDISLTTNKVEAIDEVEFQLWLNSASKWALEEMTVMPGFEATYVLDELACMATLKIKRVASDATGEATLVTIPVYAWSWDEELGTCTASYQWNKYGCAPQVDVSYKIKYGFVTYTDAFQVDDSKYFAGFSSIRQDVDTELNSSIANLKKNIGEWHYHTEVAVDDVAATCTGNGHTGRTMCSVCQSILNWGTTKATGHSFEILNGIYGCACGEKFNGEKDGVTYIDGVAYVNGWYGDTYYFVDGKKVVGPYVIDGKVYTFGEDGVYQSNAIFTGFIDTPKGKMYFLSNEEYVTGYSYISNVPYYFDANGIARDGEYEMNGEKCLFEDGVYVSCSTANLVMAGWAGMDVHFVFYQDGRFVFTGKGGMFYHQSNATIAWAKEREQITSIFVGKDITDIARFAFAHAYFVTELTFEEGSVLEAVGYKSFHYLNKIKTLKLPETVKTIGWCGFGYMTSLKSVWLPDGIESIHKDAFMNHDAAMVLQVAEGSYAHDYAKQYGFEVELRERIPMVLDEGTCGELTWTLYDTGLLKIDGNGAIPNYHYSKYNANAAPWALNREKITKVEIGSGVTAIGEFAFYQCGAMTEVVFAEGALTEIAKGAFGYTGLKAITLPASLKTIGDNAFYYSASLETVTFAEGSKLDRIGNYAFRDCTGLKSIYIPDSTTTIGSVIFYNCGAQVTANVARDSYAHKYAVKGGIAVEVRDPQPTVKYSGTAGALTWELYDNGMLAISGNGAMPNYHYSKYNANAAPWALYREQITKVQIGSGVTSIGEFAFYQCTNLTQVVFTEGALTEIAKGAFGYTGLKAITLPASLKTIGDNAFYYSASLETVTFAEGSKLDRIGNYAFRDCTGLKNIFIPDGVTAIGSVICYNVGNQVVLNVAENSVGHKYAVKNGYALELREALPEVLYSGTCGDLTWKLLDNGVLEISGNGAMPDYHYAKYNANAAPWALYRDKIAKLVIGSGVTRIGEFAFYQCTNLTQVVFTEGTLTEIAKGAFGYTGLTAITLPASLKTIGDNAFYYSASLETVTFAEGSKLVSVGNYAFRDCTSLKSVELPASVKSIGSAIFYNCGGQVVVKTPASSYAYNYATKQGLKVEEE